MKLISATTSDLESIMDIIADAQSFLASLGIDQWQNGYPDEHLILNDISNQESYLVTHNDGRIMGTVMFTCNSEPTYSQIEGNWLTATNSTYGVIHRMAVGNDFRKLGIAKFVFHECEQTLIDLNIASMRIDTHEDNLGMQGLLKKLGYRYCGVIYLGNGDKRLAYEKLLE